VLLHQLWFFFIFFFFNFSFGFSSYEAHAWGVSFGGVFIAIFCWSVTAAVEKEKKSSIIYYSLVGWIIA
jgi:hypothetical protein